MATLSRLQNQRLHGWNAIGPELRTNVMSLTNHAQKGSADQPFARMNALQLVLCSKGTVPRPDLMPDLSTRETAAAASSVLEATLPGSQVDCAGSPF